MLGISVSYYYPNIKYNIPRIKSFGANFVRFGPVEFSVPHALKYFVAFRVIVCLEFRCPNVS